MNAHAARLMGPLTPLPTPADAGRREQMQRNRLRSGLGWLLGGVIAAHLAGLILPPGGSVEWLGFSAAAASALGMLAAGTAQILLLARAQADRRGTAAAIIVCASLAVLTAPLAGLLSIMFGILHFAMAVGVAVLGTALLAGRLRARAVAPRAWLSAAAGVIVGAGVLAAGVIDTLVLLPTALAPGVPLAEIGARLAAADEDGGAWMPILWAGLWLASMLVLAAGLLRSRCSASASLGSLLAASAVAVSALPAMQFAIGMSLADTFGSGGVSPAYPVILAGGAVLAALAAGLLIRATRRTG